MNPTPLQQRTVHPPAKPDHVDREPPEHPSGDPPTTHPTTARTAAAPRGPQRARVARRCEAPH